MENANRLDYSYWKPQTELITSCYFCNIFKITTELKLNEYKELQNKLKYTWISFCDSNWEDIKTENASYLQHHQT